MVAEAELSNVAAAGDFFSEDAVQAVEITRPDEVEPDAEVLGKTLFEAWDSRSYGQRQGSSRSPNAGDPSSGVFHHYAVIRPNATLPPLDLLEYLVRARRPDEGLGVFVVGGQVSLYCGDELGHGAKHSFVTDLCCWKSRWARRRSTTEGFWAALGGTEGTN